MGAEPPGDVRGLSELTERDPAGVDSVDKHEDFLVRRVDEDVA